MRPCIPHLATGLFLGLFGVYHAFKELGTGGALLRRSEGGAVYQSDYLIEFAVVARERSFSRAALQLNTSQSSLSRHVRSLETSMGLQLLERRADGVRLTADGLEIYAKVATIIEALDQIDFYVSERQRPLELTVCGLEVFPRHYRMVCERLAGFTWRGRPVGCRMLGDGALDDGDPWRAVQEGRVSMCVLPHLAGMEEPGAGLVCTPLFEGHAVAVMDAGHPLAGRPSLSMRDLSGAVLNHAQSNYHHARQWWVTTKGLLRAAGVDYVPDARTLLDDADYYADFGSGVLLVPEGYKVVDMLGATGKVVLPVEGFAFSFDAVYRANDGLAQAVAELPFGEQAAG